MEQKMEDELGLGAYSGMPRLFVSRNVLVNLI